jgi:hypothetical protein
MVSQLLPGRRRGKIAEDFPKPATVPALTHKAIMIGVRRFFSLPIVARKTRSKELFVFRFSPVVTASDIEKSLKEQFKLV